MVIADKFEFSGAYRVQSRRTSVPSSITGTWLKSRPELLDDQHINAALTGHSLWQQRARVQLRPAAIDKRTGQFATEPDILYKRKFFFPDNGTLSMPYDIVDVEKAISLWVAREPYVRRLFGDTTYENVAKQLGELSVVIANEYYVHEAGHFIGCDVLFKYDTGKFKVDGKEAWPLIYCEEFRADLHGFGFAVELLPPEFAAQIFLYNIFLRFGVHFADLVKHGRAPYGIIPFLLFHLLWKLGYIETTTERDRPRLLLASIKSSDVCSIMKRCSAHAFECLTVPELEAASELDASIYTARYVRERLTDGFLAEKFALSMRVPSLA